MDAETRDNAVRRLKSAAGHINGIIRMLEDDRYCIDVIKQIQAVQAALSRVSENILDSHLHTCVTTAIREEDAGERERVIAEVMEVFKHSSKKSP